MQVANGKIEDGIEVGNHYDKYASKNPIARYLMAGFSKSLHHLVNATGQTDIHEIGCGEGYWTIQWLQQQKNVRACDFSSIAIALAKQNAQEAGMDANVFSQKSIEELTPADKAPLVICCEVLEHLAEPELALQRLASIADPWLIVSVPREPIWRILNLLRGKYILKLGNTPGHVQHWGKQAFIQLVSQHVDIVETRSPFPWTMLLCKKRTAAIVQ
jgi:2-polyprenyl-3-methyl-5-hydroxy-6-metoxy-1,4-benzoquinol methylase